jgi:hypothetical protein
MHFRLVMTHAGDDYDAVEAQGQGVSRILDFVFDPDVDTADNLASEIGERSAAARPASRPGRCRGAGALPGGVAGGKAGAAAGRAIALCCCMERSAGLPQPTCRPGGPCRLCQQRQPIAQRRERPSPLLQLTWRLCRAPSREAACAPGGGERTRADRWPPRRSATGEEFTLSSTDTEICAAALREWLAKEMPGSENNK